MLIGLLVGAVGLVSGAPVVAWLTVAVVAVVGVLVLRTRRRRRSGVGR